MPENTYLSIKNIMHVENSVPHVQCLSSRMWRTAFLKPHYLATFETINKSYIWHVMKTCRKWFTKQDEKPISSSS